MGEWVSRCDEEKYTQCGVDSKNHLQIQRLSGLMPRPARRPYDRQRIHRYEKYETEHD